MAVLLEANAHRVLRGGEEGKEGDGEPPRTRRSYTPSALSNTARMHRTCTHTHLLVVLTVNEPRRNVRRRWVELEMIDCTCCLEAGG